MSVHKINLDWHVAVDDEDWRRLQQTPQSTPTQTVPVATVRPPRRLWISMVALALLVASGAWVWQAAHRGMRQLEQEVNEGVLVEMGTLAVLDESMAQQANIAAEDELLREKLHGVMADEVPQIDTDLVVISHDTVAARALIQLEEGQLLRQVRFYRRTSTGWQPIAPDSSLWGAAQRLESVYFVFWFQQQDGMAVRDAAARLDALYDTMLHNFGLPAPATKRVIRVSLQENPQASYRLLAEDGAWVVASPARYLAPVEISDGDLLAQSIVLALLDDTIAAAKAHYGIHWRWQPLYEGLYLWQLWSLDVPLAAWQDELVAWYLSDIPSDDASWPFNYGELCAAHMLWMQRLTDIHILFLCTDHDHYVMCCSPRRISPSIPEVGGAFPYEEPYCMRNCSLELEKHLSNWPYCAGESIALATVIEHAVAAYGSDHLPALLASMGRDERWDIVVANSFDVSAAQFEQGWQEYVRTHYVEAQD